MPDPTATPTGLLVCGADAATVADVAARLTDGLVVVGAPERADVPRAVAAVAERLGGAGGGLVACGADPWPAWDPWLAEVEGAARGHDVATWRVASWHRLPVLVDAVVAAAREGLGAGSGDAHLLVTAPHAAGAAVEPTDRTFLREVAEDVAARLDGVRPTIAFDRAPAGVEATSPDLTAVLTALAEAHGRRRVVRVSVDPDDGRDAAGAAHAAGLGLELVQPAVASGTRAAALAAVLATVRAHEDAGR
ncbi:MAG: hypothetical protein ACLGIR_02260 [Actinomycetes bacterium]